MNGERRCGISNGILLGNKKEGNVGICNNVDGPWGYHTKLNKRMTNTVWIHLYVESKQNKTNEQTKQTHRYREQTGGYQRGRSLGGGQKGWKGSIVWWWMVTRHTGWTFGSVFRY